MPKKFTPRPDKINLDDVTLEKRFKHEVSGAVLYLAKREDAATGNAQYTVMWAASWQKNVKDFTVYNTKTAALSAFNTAKAKEPPTTPSLTRDFQVNKVYRWEGDTLDKESVKLTPEQMKRVVKRISEDFNMVAPKIRYKDPDPNQANPASYYYAHLNKILMRHKKLSFVIHEVAHAIDHQINGNKWSDHGPSFVRTLIRLADRYQDR